MNFEIENKSIFASDNGKGIDKNKDTIVFLHGSGLSHIVWSLSEQFFQIIISMYYLLIYQDMEILRAMFKNY